MGLFVNIEIDASKFDSPAALERCARVCPVDAFVVEGDHMRWTRRTRTSASCATSAFRTLPRTR